MMKITDLEKFALEQVYRPYANKLLMIDTRFDRLHTHYELDDIMLQWEKLVMNRIVGLLLSIYLNLEIKLAKPLPPHKIAYSDQISCIFIQFYYLQITVRKK